MRRRIEEEAVTTRFSVVTADDESVGLEHDPVRAERGQKMRPDPYAHLVT